MLITKPPYYDRFHCIADRCPDSCCRLWDVQVDADTAAFYRSLPGPLGDRMREFLYDEEEETYIGLEEGRCPFWRQDGLCRIQAELGAGALSHVCTEFPRLRHDYGDFMELGLELSCPEAARLILTAAPAPDQTLQVPEGEAPDYDHQAMAVLKQTRREALALLQDRPAPQALALLLLYGYHAQALLDGEPARPFDAGAALQTARELACEGSLEEILQVFSRLEILTEEWRTRLNAPENAGVSEMCLPLARYFVSRYWLQAVSDYDLVCRVKFTVVACLVISGLGGDFLRTAQLFSKEIENDADNMDALLDAAYDEPAFTDARILGLLTES